jgi:hypothetical protein
MTAFNTGSIAALAALLFSAAPASASAAPDLRRSRTAGPLTVYADDGRANVFYYPPGELAVATREDGSPDVRLLLARYTGSVVTRDQGRALYRSVLTVHVVLGGPSTVQLAEARQQLAAQQPGAIELRPLPIRRLESALVYAPVAEPTSGTPPAASSGEQALPAGHFEAADENPAAGPDGYWSDRVYTLRLGESDAQLLSSALEHGQVAISIGYAFLTEGARPDDPLQQLSGSPALVAELQKLVASPATSGTGTEKPLAVVRAGAVGVTADLARWPQIVRRIDINDSAPPGYAAMDIYCYDFNQGTWSALYEKQIEIQADGIGGRSVSITTSFNRSQPDLYARSVRFPVAVRLDRPYRFRVVEISQDGTSSTTPWQARSSWTDLLDVTTQGERR